MSLLEREARPAGITPGWTDDRVELLKKLHCEHLSAAKMAVALGGVTRNSVLGKLHRLGLNSQETQDVWSERETEILKIVWNTGIKVSEVVEELLRQCGTNRTTRAVAAKADRLGLAKKKQKALHREHRAFEPADFTPMVVPADFKSMNIPFMEVQSMHCREVTGWGNDGLAAFCGHKRRSGSSFCEIHHRINWKTPQFFRKFQYD